VSRISPDAALNRRPTSRMKSNVEKAQVWDSGGVISRNPMCGVCIVIEF